MFNLFQNERRRAKDRRQRSVRLFEEELEGRCLGKGKNANPVRLFLEELEGRCLLSVSGAVSPVGPVTIAPDGSVWFLGNEPTGQPTGPIPGANGGPLEGTRPVVERLDPATGLIQELAIPDFSWNWPYPPSEKLILGPDGDIWFYEGNFGQFTVYQLDPVTDAIKEIPIAANITGMTAGADNGVWILEQKSSGDFSLARIDPVTHAIDEHALPVNFNLWMTPNPCYPRYQLSVYAWGLTASPDGSLWVEEDYEASPVSNGLMLGICSIVKGGFVARYVPGTGESQVFELDNNPVAMTGGADGNLWKLNWEWYNGFELIRTSIVRFNPNSGQTQQFEVSIAEYNPNDFFGSVAANGQNGSIWCSVFNPATGSTDIDQLDLTSGAVSTKLVVPTSPPGLTVGPDGIIWLSQTDSIGEFNPTTGSYREFDGQALPSSGFEQSSGSTAANSFISATGTVFSTIAGFDLATIFSSGDSRNAIATFTPQTPVSSPGAAYQATVDWGDGTTSSLVVTVSDNSTYDLTAGHTYQSAGTYSIKVTIGNYNQANPLGDNPITVFSTAKVDPFNMGM